MAGGGGGSTRRGARQVRRTEVWVLEGAGFMVEAAVAGPMTRPLLREDTLELARAGLEEMALCDHCLGRLVWRAESGMGNDERGRIVREELEAPGVAVEDCDLCEGLLLDVDLLVEVALEALEGWSFDTYLVGMRVEQAIEEREQALWEALGLEDTESVGSELNRLVGKAMDPELEAEVEFRKPDVTVIVDTRFLVADVEARPLFLFGRYRKLERGIPQTRWPCRKCKGTGCDACDRTGKTYMTSVEELVAEVPVEVTGAEDASFHGAGREDVDARMLGTGRPFVLELTKPRVRDADVQELEEAINAHVRQRGASGGPAGPDGAKATEGPVEVEGLRWTTRDEVAHAKGYRGGKTYRAEVTFDTPVPREKLKKVVGGLRGRRVHQRTPSRVSHRRADRVRKRTVRDARVESHDNGAAVLIIEGDAGLYIKELVHGDEGRTEPSVAGLLGVEARVDHLDVTAVEYEPPGGAKTRQENSP